MRLNKVAGIVFSILVFSYPVRPDDIQTNGRVCADPSASCQSSKWQFRPYDLSFKLPPALKWLNNYRSLNFYAIILKSMPTISDPDGPPGQRECSGYVSEIERMRVQEMFPKQKVFASRFGCGSPGVWYTNINAEYNFLAVYAGETQAAADTFLRTVRGSFPGANLGRPRFS
jgi:hypothetical protein